jgi:hypothetical protein
MVRYQLLVLKTISNAYQMEGCETCRRRKVKCDERHPNCEECARLSLSCRWSQGKRLSIKRSRRGYGPVKSRPDTWVPPPLAPTPSEPSIEEARVDISSPSELEWSNSVIADKETISNDWLEELDMGIDNLSFLKSLDDPFSFEDPQITGFSQELVGFEHRGTNCTSNDQQITCGLLEMDPCRSLSDFHMALPNSLKLSPYEHEALRHYQTTYSLYRTTKDPNWSTHRVLLRMGSHDKMIMHLLLAASLNDYSIRTGYSSSSEEAESNFRAGAQLFINASSTYSETDEVVMMAAYFFLYLYMSKRKSIAPQRLSQLSLTALNYVKKHDLLTNCISSQTLSDPLHFNKTPSCHNRSLLARLIMWTLDEDVKCSFQGSGGHFARHLVSCDAKTKDVYDVSRNALGDHWGTLYPHSQALDDDQNSTVLEFLWALMPLWQDINDLSLESDPSDLKSQIEQKFILLEEVCESFGSQKRIINKF